MSKYRQILKPGTVEPVQEPTAEPDEAPPSRNRKDVLSLYQALPWDFVGDPKSGKKTLARAMLAEPWKVLTKMYVAHKPLLARTKNTHAASSHTTATLPLPDDASRPRIDFIVFFVDMTSAKSLSNLKMRLLKVDKDYYAQGRSCIVATRVDLNRSHAFTMEHLEAVVDVYGMSVFYCNLTKPDQLQNLCVRVYKSAELANGFIPFISPLIFGAP